MEHRLLPFKFLVILGAVVALQGGSTSAIDEAVPLIAIDTFNAGNTSTALGSVETCGQVQIGQPLTLDVVVRGVPEHDQYTQEGGLAGFGFTLRYDPLIVSVAAADPDYFLSGDAPRVPFDIADPLPDNDGDFRMDSVDFRQVFEGGDGALARLTILGVAPGESSLILAGLGTPVPELADPAARLYRVDRVQPATLSVGNAGCFIEDVDLDGLLDPADNCPSVPNSDQLNTDGDAAGDACDQDDDGDRFNDDIEITFGADPLSPLATPEYLDPELGDYTPCLDGRDNDLDGVLDLDEPMCAQISLPPPPNNDNFESAVPTAYIPPGHTDRYLGASLQQGEALPCGGIGKTTWYKHTASQAGSLQAYAGLDSRVAIYSGDGLQSLQILACSQRVAGNQVAGALLDAGETVYIQVARQAFRSTEDPVGFSSDLDGDRVPDAVDNCISVINPQQEDDDKDGLGDSCDEFPRHNLAVRAVSVRAPTFGPGRPSVSFYIYVLVANQSDHEETVAVRIESIEYQIPGCGIYTDWWDSSPESIPAGETRTVRVRAHLGCAERRAPGQYTVNLTMVAGHIPHQTRFSTKLRPTNLTTDSKQRSR